MIGREVGLSRKYVERSYNTVEREESDWRAKIENNATPATPSVGVGPATQQAT